jgi:hypothetical protein
MVRCWSAWTGQEHQGRTCLGSPVSASSASCRWPKLNGLGARGDAADRALTVPDAGEPTCVPALFGVRAVTAPSECEQTARGEQCARAAPHRRSHPGIHGYPGGPAGRPGLVAPPTPENRGIGRSSPPLAIPPGPAPEVCATGSHSRHKPPVSAGNFGYLGREGGRSTSLQMMRNTCK